MYVREVLERDLKREVPHPEMTFQELLALASGLSPADQMTDEELAEFAEAEVKAHRAERRVESTRG